jgi:hypothetical protein
MLEDDQRKLNEISMGNSKSKSKIKWHILLI